MTEQGMVNEKAQTKPNKAIRQFLSFSIIGVLNTAVDIAVYWLLLQLSVVYVLANIAAYAAGMLNSFIWNRAINFRTKQREKHAFDVILRFVLWNLLSLLLSSLLITLLIEGLQWHELWSKLVATACIVVFQFIGMKKWVFRQ